MKILVRLEILVSLVMTRMLTLSTAKGLAHLLFLTCNNQNTLKPQPSVLLFHYKVFLHVLKKTSYYKFSEFKKSSIESQMN